MDNEFSVVQLSQLAHVSAKLLRAGPAGHLLREGHYSPFVARACAVGVRLAGGVRITILR
jgi:hypothetical protein